jgi:hypothetical protein
MQCISSRKLTAGLVWSACALGCAGTVREGQERAAADAAVDTATTPLDASASPTSDAEPTRDADDAGVRPARDASTRDATSARAPVAAGLVPLFVAVGEMGRTTVSCDEGRSWVADKSDTEAHCSGSDCDHNSSIPTGLAYAEGRWFASRGWGFDGPVAYTDDGERWTTASVRGRWDGLAAGPGLLFVQSSTVMPKLSKNAGVAFEDRPAVNVTAHVRGQVYLLDGKLWILSDDGEVRMSSDEARTWRAPRMLDARCARKFQPNQGGLAYDGKGVLVVIGWDDGITCRSTDHGETFSYVTSFGAVPTTPIVWADDQFWVWTGNRLRRSRDGATWSNEETGVRQLMPVARSDEGTWVAADGAYESEQLLRSQDGLKWEVLPRDKYKQSHRLRRIVFGYGKKPAACD